MKNQHNLLLVLWFVSTTVFSQEVRVGLNTCLGDYNQAAIEMPIRYYPNVGLDFSYVHRLKNRSSLSIGVSNLTHSYQAFFSQATNREVEIFGSVSTWEVPINFIQEFTSQGTYFSLGLGFSTSKTQIPGRIKGSTAENINRSSQSISHTSPDKRVFNIVPKIGIGQKFRIGKKQMFFAEFNAGYYSKVPDITIFYRRDLDLYSFDSPKSAIVYKVQIGYVIPWNK